MNIYCNKPSLSVLSAPVLVLNGSTEQNRNKLFLAPKSVFLSDISFFLFSEILFQITLQAAGGTGLR